MDRTRGGDGPEESRARALLARLGDAQAPPTRVNVDLARGRGLRALRWRRAGQAGVPALAALAVVAVVATTPLPFRAGGHGHVGPSAAGQHRVITPVRQFDPLIPYVAFGWLPRGESLDGGQLDQWVAYLVAGHDSAWSLTVWAQGHCQRSGARLQCASSPSAGWIGTISGPAPDVDGHRAFWLQHDQQLAWQYASGSWATLIGPGKDTMVEVARHVRYGVASRPSIEFAVQLTGLSRAWQVSSMFFVPDRAGGHTVLRASEYSLITAMQTPVNQPAPNLTTGPATRQPCYLYLNGWSVRTTINGYHVVVTHIPAQHGNAPVQQVCAARADGLRVIISTYGHPAVTAITLFRHHTRLLGPDPAGWTTRPVS
jgi:hypothetical protein